MDLGRFYIQVFSCIYRWLVYIKLHMWNIHKWILDHILVFFSCAVYTIRIALTSGYWSCYSGAQEWRIILWIHLLCCVWDRFIYNSYWRFVFMFLPSATIMCTSPSLWVQGSVLVSSLQWWVMDVIILIILLLKPGSEVFFPSVHIVNCMHLKTKKSKFFTLFSFKKIFHNRELLLYMLRN